jgi:hypothetical protein
VQVSGFRHRGGEPEWGEPRAHLDPVGYANDFYAAAVQAGTQSWKAWMFGSLDSGSAITVDKPRPHCR